MAYIKNTWVDQEVERPRTYQKEDHADGSFTLIDDFGLVSELGTPVNADNMNHIEEGIGEHEERITALENLPDVYLKTNQITNCITEIPQRIKADVTDGTLTVYAGTVAIVPYGTTDRTSEFPVGSTFIHENFKIIDTQFADNKFFIWVEVQSDISDAPTISDTKERLVEIELTKNKFWAVTSSTSGTTQYSGTGNNINYRTDLNIMQQSVEGTLTTNVCSLPILITPADGTYVHGSISQTFNGIGYIGSTMWVDKGVKGLIPNGRNDDESLKNIEFTTERISMRTFASSSTGYVRTFLSNTHVVESQYSNKVSSDYVKPTNINYWYNILSNKWILCTTDEQKFMFSLADCYLDSGVISDFKPKMPFRAVDYSDVHVKTYVNGTSWYRIHPDGWIEQGGVITTTTTPYPAGKTISLIKTMTTSNYTLVATAKTTNQSGYYTYQDFGIASQSASSFSFRLEQSTYYTAVNWYACGY